MQKTQILSSLSALSNKLWLFTSITKSATQDLSVSFTTSLGVKVFNVDKEFLVPRKMECYCQLSRTCVDLLTFRDFHVLLSNTLTSYRGGKPRCYGPPSDPKMKKCKAKPSSFSKSKPGLSRVFGVRPEFQFSCEKPLVAQKKSVKNHLQVEIWAGLSG